MECFKNRVFSATEVSENTENSQLCVLGKRFSQSKLFQNVLPSPTSANRPFIKLTVFLPAILPILTETKLLQVEEKVFLVPWRLSGERK
jgi:hypothetical protein